MTNALLSELRKMVTTRLVPTVVIAMVVVVGGLSALMALAAHVADGRGPIDLADPAALAPYYYAAPVTGAVFAAVLGAAAATAESRHGTWAGTLLAEPRRGVVLAAKVLVQVPFGLLLGLVATLTCVGAFAGTLLLTGHETHLGGTSPGPYLAGMAAFATWAVIGAGLGLVVSHQAVVISAVLLLTLLVEPVLRGFAAGFPALDGLSRALPGVATEALSGGRLFPSPVADAMGTEQGAAVLLAYAVALVALGAVVLRRREV